MHAGRCCPPRCADNQATRAPDRNAAHLRYRCLAGAARQNDEVAALGFLIATWRRSRDPPGHRSRQNNPLGEAMTPAGRADQLKSSKAVTKTLTNPRGQALPRAGNRPTPRSLEQGQTRQDCSADAGSPPPQKNEPSATSRSHPVSSPSLVPFRPQSCLRAAVRVSTQPCCLFPGRAQTRGSTRSHLKPARPRR